MECIGELPFLPCGLPPPFTVINCVLGQLQWLWSMSDKTRIQPWNQTSLGTHGSALYQKQSKESWNQGQTIKRWWDTAYNDNVRIYNYHFIIYDTFSILELCIKVVAISSCPGKIMEFLRRKEVESLPCVVLSFQNTK